MEENNNMILSLDEFENFVPKRKTFGLFGYPIKHTLSPLLHSLLLEDTDCVADYIAVQVNPDELEKAYNIAKQKLSGINITIPHKTKIMTLLESIDPSALDIGCVNTINFLGDDKKAYGYNTDIYGFSQSLQSDGVNIKSKNVTILGNGGTALMSCYYMLMSGANLTIAVRNIDKGTKLANTLKTIFSSRKQSLKVNVCTLDQIDNSTQIIVNCTSAGMFPNIDYSPIDILPADCEYVYDVIYNPYTTKLLDMANERGIKNANGLDMLILQGAKAQTIWQGIEFEGNQCKDLSIIHEKLKAIYDV